MPENFPTLHRLSRWVLLWFLTALPVLASADEAALFSEKSKLTEGRLVEAVLARNPTLNAIRAAWQAAKARIEQASALDDPRLSYGFAPRTLDAADLDFGYQVELSQAFPWPGKLSLKGEHAQREAEAAFQDIASARQRLALEAQTLYGDWYYIFEAIRINRINQSLWQDFKAIAETQYAVGRATQQDALRADVEYNLLVHQAIVLERGRQEILARLNTLLNRAPDRPIPPPAPLPEPIPLPEAAYLRVAAVKARPELKTLAARHKGQQAQAALARREYYPDFVATGGYNSLWDRDEKRFTVGVAINIPLYLGKRRAAVDEAKARALQIEWALAEQRTEIAGEVQRAFDAVEESRHVLRLYRKKLLPLAEETLEAAKADYRAGRGDFLNLVSTERNLMQTQLNAAQALADYHRRLAQLAYSIGDAKAFISPAALGGRAP